MLKLPDELNLDADIDPCQSREHHWTFVDYPHTELPNAYHMAIRHPPVRIPHNKVEDAIHYTAVIRCSSTDWLLVYRHIHLVE